MRRAAALLLATGLALLASAPTVATAEEPQACRRDRPDVIAQAPAAFDALGIRTAWRLSRGAGVTVAVVDSGVHAANQHLTDAVAAGVDLTASGGDGRTDEYGHGTIVAAQIAARQVKGSGLVGVAPEATIVPVRVYEGTGQDQAGPDTKLTARGIDWASARGIPVIVVAQSTTTDLPELRAAVQRATRRGSLVVASAGNADKESGNAVVFPAGYADALAVTALDAAGQPSDAVRHGVHVEIAAPGAQVLSAYFDSDCLFGSDSPASSYATAYVAGAAALVAAAHPDERPADWEYRLLATAIRPAGTARDPRLGWGIVAPYDALNFINDGSATGPENPRHPPPVQTVAPALPLPEPAPDLQAPVTRAVGVVLLAGGILFTGGLLFARLRARG
nr:S8 family serine peptidase [Propionicimonas sp.]